MINLPQEYCDNMKKLLGEDEFNEYIKSFDKKPDISLRINTLKISLDEWNEISSFDMCPTSLLFRRALLYTRAKCDDTCIYLAGRRG